MNSTESGEKNQSLMTEQNSLQIKDDRITRFIVSAFLVEISAIVVISYLSQNIEGFLETLAYCTPVAAALVAGFAIYSKNSQHREAREKIFYIISAWLLQIGFISFWCSSFHSVNERMAFAIILSIMAISLAIASWACNTDLENGKYQARSVLYASIVLIAACLIGLALTLFIQ